TFGSTDRRRVRRSTWAGTAANACGVSPIGCAHGSTTATTSTRTSTTTTTAPPCSTPGGCARSSTRDQVRLVRLRRAPHELLHRGPEIVVHDLDAHAKWVTV